LCIKGLLTYAGLIIHIAHIIHKL